LEIRYLLKNNILFKHFVAGGLIGTSNAYCTLALTHLRGWLAQKNVSRRWLRHHRRRMRVGCNSESQITHKWK